VVLFAVRRRRNEADELGPREKLEPGYRHHWNDVPPTLVSDKFAEGRILPSEMQEIINLEEKTTWA